MTHKSRARLIAILTVVDLITFGILIYLVTPWPAQIQSVRRSNPPTFDSSTWIDESGQIRTRSELDEILLEHQPADLRGAIFWGTDLSGAQLENAKLTGANLVAVNLSHALLSKADLSHVLMSNLGTRDPAPDQTRASITLGPQQLFRTNLTGADLRGANLSEAVISQADFKDAELDSADLGGTVFEPYSLPAISIAAARNLEFMTYSRNPTSLVQLRNEFRDQGLLEQEQKITYALKRREAELLFLGCSPWARVRWPLQDSETEAQRLQKNYRFDSLLLNCANYSFNRLFFDMTSQYGMTPGRSLRLLGVLWAVCAILYYCLIRFSKHATVIVVPSNPPVTGSDEDKNKPRKFRRIQRIGRLEGKPRSLFQWIEHERGKGCTQSPFQLSVRGTRRWLRLKWRRARAAMFLSLMSAFNIGFRDINFGRWLRLLTKREYDIRAVGWARAIAGWQSLISVYLIALWVLTYFGRPFE